MTCDQREHLMTSFLRIIKMGAVNFWRNGWMSVAATTIVTLTLFTISVFIILNFVVDIAVDEVEEDIDMRVSFIEETEEKKVLNVKYELLSLEDVEDVKYVNQEEAKQEAIEFIKRTKKDPRLIDIVTEGVLSVSLKIKAKDPKNLQNISGFLEKEDYKEIIKGISYKQKEEVIKNILNFTDIVKKIVLGLFLVFIIIALVILLNTIRITIFTRASEIEIMKLVGATNWYIRGPFILEGSFYGIIATVISIIVLYPILYFVSPYIYQTFDNYGQTMFSYFNSHFISITGLMILTGILLGTISSIIAMQRYLKKV